MFEYMYANADRINLFVGYIGMAVTLITAAALFWRFERNRTEKRL